MTEVLNHDIVGYGRRPSGRVRSKLIRSAMPITSRAVPKHSRLLLSFQALLFSSVTWHTEAVFSALVLPKLVGILLAATFLVQHDLARELRNLAGTTKRPAFPYVIYALTGAFFGLMSPSPLLASFKSIQILVGAYWIASLYRCRDECDLGRYFRTIMNFLSILLLVALAGAILRPGQSFTKVAGPLGVQLRSVTPAMNANSLGMFALIVVISCLVLKNQTPGPRAAKLSLAIVVLALAQSRTVFVILPLIPLWFIARDLQSKRGIRTLGVALLGAGAVMIAAPRLLLIFVRGQSGESLRSASGRSDIWRFFFNDGVPFSGGGIGTATRFTSTSEVGYQKVATLGSAHNGYVEAVLGSGILGATPLLLLFFVTATSAIRTAARPRNSSDVENLAAVLAIALLIRAVTGSGLTTAGLDSVIFLLCVVTLSGRKRSVRVRNSQRPATSAQGAGGSKKANAFLR